MALRMNEHNNGYMAMGRYAVWTSDVNDNDKPDLNEAFFTKRERPSDDPLVRAGRRFAGPNRWPDDLPGFRESVLAYTDAMDALTRRLLPACALALDLPPDAFDAAFAESQFSFRLSHYPPVAAEANQFGIAPHTDANFLTFLAQSEVPGLQVRMPSGEWIDVPYVPDSYAVNSGDMMTRWTNGRFKSTPHRAVPPVGRHRYAIPFFLGPHIDTVIACLPTCQSAGNPPRFEPITYDAYLHWWYDANYNASRSRTSRRRRPPGRSRVSAPSPSLPIAASRFVIVFVVDGLRPDSITPDDTPTLQRLRTEGVAFTNSHAVFPPSRASTRPRWPRARSRARAGSSATRCTSRPVDPGRASAPTTIAACERSTAPPAGALVLVPTLAERLQRAGSAWPASARARRAARSCSNPRGSGRRGRARQRLLRAGQDRGVSRRRERGRSWRASDRRRPRAAWPTATTPWSAWTQRVLREYVLPELGRPW